MIGDYIGKPFVDGGRGPDEYDCWGLVKAVFRSEYGLELPEYYISAFDREQVAETMMEQRAARWERVEDRVPGNIVCISLDMRMPRAFINHVGVYIGDDRFIHTRESTGAVIERASDFKWKNRVEGYYEYAP